MNLFKTIFYTIVISIFLVSCKKDPLPVLTLSADKIVFSNKTSTETISVSSNFNWSISNDSESVLFSVADIFTVDSPVEEVGVIEIQSESLEIDQL